MADRYAYNLNRLLEIRSLHAGWDGSDAKKFTPDFCDTVAKILSCVLVQPEIFPISTGAIQLEYDFPDRKEGCIYLEIDIYTDGKTVEYHEFADGSSGESEIACTAEAINGVYAEYADWYFVSS